MDRRSFLQHAAVLAGSTTLADAGRRHGGDKGRKVGVPRRPDWAALAGSLTGTLVLPGNPAYGSGAQLYDEVFAPRPAAIAACASASDVQRCVSFARDNGVPLAARSGGHSYGGYSSSEGLVIDVRALNAVTPGGGLTTAAVGAGASLMEVYGQLGAAGVLLPGGSCPTVGIAGLALGGGIGVFGRAFGLTCDNIASLRMVTADGTLRTCSATESSDLYWASRGGGGGNFGVVTSFTFNVHPIPPVTLFTLEWPWAEAATVLNAWLRWVPLTPNELWANCQLAADGLGAGQVKVTGVFAGSASACDSALAPLRTAVGAVTTYEFVGPEDYLRAMLIEAGCEGLTVEQCRLAAPGSAGTLSRSSFVAKSSFVVEPLGASAVSALLTAVEDLDTSMPGTGGGVVFDSYGGVIGDIAPTATAFAHRRAIACAQYSIAYGSPTPSPSTVATAQGWLRGVADVIAPSAAGSYVNYIDPTLPDWATAYYGANLARLREVKRRHDPHDLFHFAQSIPLPA